MDVKNAGKPSSTSPTSLDIREPIQGKSETACEDEPAYPEPEMHQNLSRVWRWCEPLLITSIDRDVWAFVLVRVSTAVNRHDHDNSYKGKHLMECLAVSEV